MVVFELNHRFLLIAGIVALSHPSPLLSPHVQPACSTTDPLGVQTFAWPPCIRASSEFPAAFLSATISSISSLKSYAQYAALCFWRPKAFFDWWNSFCVASDHIIPDRSSVARVLTSWGFLSPDTSPCK